MRVLDRRAAVLERDAGLVVERAPALLRAGEQRQPDDGLVVHLAALGRLAAEADARPAQVERRLAGQRAAGDAPQVDHDVGLPPADLVGPRRSAPIEAGRHVALVGVAVRVDDLLPARNATLA